MFAHGGLFLRKAESVHESGSTSDGALVELFMRNAPASAVVETLKGVGNALSASDMLPPDVVSRMCRLYEHVFSIYEARSPEEKSEVLSIFGLWFLSPQLDSDWALDTLQRTLVQTNHKLRIEFRVLERLAELAIQRPAESVKALLAMIHTQFIFSFMHQDSIRTILAKAVADGGEAKNIAVRVNDALVNMGIRDYLEVFRQ